MSDDAKKLVLARRARFVAAAIAGMSIACGKENAPHPCLDVPPAEDASVPTPQPCLSVYVPPPDAEPPKPSPQPCLKLPPPRDAGKGCDPPFTIDAKGLKHFKPECL